MSSVVTRFTSASIGKRTSSATLAVLALRARGAVLRMVDWLTINVFSFRPAEDERRSDFIQLHPFLADTIW